jgi:hypothetical protein
MTPRETTGDGSEGELQDEAPGVSLGKRVRPLTRS